MAFGQSKKHSFFEKKLSLFWKLLGCSEAYNLNTLTDFKFASKTQSQYKETRISFITKPVVFMFSPALASLLLSSSFELYN